MIAVAHACEPVQRRRLIDTLGGQQLIALARLLPTRSRGSILN